MDVVAFAAFLGLQICTQKCRKALNTNGLTPLLAFVISRSGVRVRPPAPASSRTSHRSPRRTRQVSFVASFVLSPTKHSFCQGSQVNTGEFPSGQRGQTVNLLSLTSVVRIHPLPPKPEHESVQVFCFFLKNRVLFVPKSYLPVFLLTPHKSSGFSHPVCKPSMSLPQRNGNQIAELRSTDRNILTHLTHF